MISHVSFDWELGENDTPVEIEYDFESAEERSHWSPGYPANITVTNVWLGYSDRVGPKIDIYDLLSDEIQDAAYNAAWNNEGM